MNESTATTARDADAEFVLDGIDQITVAPHDSFIIGAFNEDQAEAGAIIDVHILPELDDESWERVFYFCVTPACGAVTVSIIDRGVTVESPLGTATFPQCGRLRLYAENAEGVL